MDKIKLLVVVTAYQSVVTILSSKLKNLSQIPYYKIFVASSEKEPDETREPPVVFFPIYIPRAIHFFHDVRAIIALIFLIKRNKIDVLHTHTAKAGIVGAFAGWICGIPVFHSYHGLPFYPGQKRIAYWAYRGIEILTSRLRCCLFSQNKFDTIVLRRIRAIHRPIVFEGNGVDGSAVMANALQHLSFVKSMYAENATKLLCVARLEPVKHIEKIIAAVDFLKKEGAAIQCIIAGKGPLREALERRIYELCLDDIIKIIYTPFIHALIGCADIVMLASEKEGIPRSLMEAMVLEKPIVATNVVGTNELVEHEVTGLSVPFHDQESFNRALLRLVNDEPLRAALGKAGYRRIIERFDEKNIVALWNEHYQRYIR